METKHIADLAHYELPELKRRGFLRRCYHEPTGKPVRKKSYYLAEEVDEVIDILEKRQFEALPQLHCKMLTPLELLVVSTKDGQFAAAQIRCYRPYEFGPESGIMVFDGAEAKALVETLKKVKPVDKGLWK